MMKIKNITLFSSVLTLILLFSIGSVSAKKDKFEFEEINLSDWAIKADTAKKIKDAVYIFEKLYADDEKLLKNKCYLTVYRRIRILTDDGRDYGDIEIPIYEQKQKIKFIKGRTILPDNTIIELTEDNIFEKDAVKYKKEKTKQKTFSMPGLTNNCIIEYAYKVELKRYQYRWMAQKEIPVLDSEYKWRFYKAESSEFMLRLIQKLGPTFDYRAPNYLWYNGQQKLKIDYLPDRKEPKEILIHTGFIPAYEKEPYTFPKNALTTKMYVYYGSSKSSMSFWFNWAEYDSRYYGSFCKENDKVIDLVEQFSDLPTDKEKIDAAFKWVQDNIFNLTYFDMMDPKDPTKEAKLEDIEYVDDVIKYGYGYRLDIDVLFFDMLRQMDIKVRMANSVNRNNDFFVKQAKFDQFGKTLVAVHKRADQYDYYTPGHLYSTPDMIPAFFEGVDIILIDADELFSISSFSKPDKNVVSRSYEINIDEDLVPSGKVKSRLSGLEARWVRISTYEEEDVAKKIDIINEDQLEFYPGSEIDSTTVGNIENPYERLELDFDITYPPLSEQGSRLMIKPSLLFSKAENPFTEDDRKNHVLFDYAFKNHEVIQLNIPEEWVLEAMPNDTSYRNTVGSCEIHFTKIGNSISIDRQFILNSPYMQVAEYKKVQRLFRMNDVINDLMIVLKEAE